MLIPASIAQPNINGERADAKTMQAVTKDFIAPIYLVPYISAHKELSNEFAIPRVIPARPRYSIGVKALVEEDKINKPKVRGIR